MLNQSINQSINRIIPFLSFSADKFFEEGKRWERDKKLVTSSAPEEAEGASPQPVVQPQLCPNPHTSCFATSSSWRRSASSWRLELSLDWILGKASALEKRFFSVASGEPNILSGLDHIDSSPTLGWFALVAPILTAWSLDSLPSHFTIRSICSPGDGPGGFITLMNEARHAR